MGYSDIQPYDSEISTPALNSLISPPPSSKHGSRMLFSKCAIVQDDVPPMHPFLPAYTHTKQ
eukprot:15342282-Ditylum_brightwellii.AAC.1